MGSSSYLLWSARDLHDYGRAVAAGVAGARPRSGCGVTVGGLGAAEVEVDSLPAQHLVAASLQLGERRLVETRLCVEDTCLVVQPAPLDRVLHVEAMVDDVFDHLK